MAVFDPNVPQAINERNADRIVMVQNFNAISDFINRNHVDFNAPGFGSHKFVTLINLNNSIATVPINGSGIANNVTAGTQELEIYNKDAQRNLSSYCMTKSFPGNPGSTFLTNGFILKWGTATINQQLDQVTFPATNQLRFTTRCLIVLPVVVNNNMIANPGFITVEEMTTTSFQIWSESTNSYVINYIALGF